MTRILFQAVTQGCARRMQRSSLIL